MSQWGNNTAAQPPVSGQVTFFDPSKFQQKDTANPGFQHVPVSQPNTAGGDQGQTDAQQNMNYHTDQASSWNTWGGWDNSNPYASDFNSGASQDPNGQSMNNDYASYNQQQYYGQQQQWNNAPATSDQGSTQWNNVPQTSVAQSQWNNVQQHTDQQWDPNAQANMDPNQHQWNQQQYHYQQQLMDPNQAGYQNYWGAQNGDIQPQGDPTQTSVMQNASSASYFNSDPTSVQYAEAGTNVPASNVTNSSIVSGEGESSGLDVSQSTESGTSGLNNSVGNVEDGGMGGFFNNDDYTEGDSDDDDDDDDDEEDDDGVEDEESNNENNSNLGASSSHIQTETHSEHNSEINEGQPPQQSNSVNQHQHFEMTDQMQALHIQDPIPSGNSGSYNTNVPNVAPQYSSQSNVNTVPVNTGPPPPMAAAPPVVHPFVPTLPDNVQQQANTDNAEVEPQSEQHATPTFSDWEIVPPQNVPSVPPVSHSRNASVDNNVQFFIGSTNSSARVSPATSGKAGDEPGAVQPQSIPKPEESEPIVSQSVGLTNAPPMVTVSNKQNLGPPPPAMGGNSGGNPFRKSPNMEPVSSSSATDISLLSSTRLDVTRPNFENSPVVLNRSISPIPSTIEGKGQGETESPEIQSADKGPVSSQDTPVSSQSRKSKITSQSPVMPRKESPFQPPKQDARGKPVRASHDIPGVNPQKSALDSGKPTDRSYGRKTPDWDVDSNRYEGRRTPDRDRRRRYDRDREDRDKKRNGDRYGPESEHLSSRPPAGPGANERPPTRTRQSAFHHIQTNRGKNNVSPAVSLLDVADSVSTVSNIMLLPATSSVSGGVSPSPAVSAPLELNPVVSLISTMSEQISTDNVDSNKRDLRDNKSSERDRDSKDRYRERDRYRDEKSRYTRDKDRGSREDIRGNRSYDNLRDRSFKDSRNNSREKLSMYGSRDSLDERDDSRDRSRRGDSRERDRSYRDEYYDRYRDRNRPPSRGSTVDTRRDYRDRDRDRDYYRRTDKYDRDRPRSRQGDRDRPLSRQGDSDRPRSRADYDREIEKYREKYKGYGDYDEYYRRHYYDRQYYDYYYNQGQYSQAGGYYDEHGYYHQDPNAQRYQYDHHHRRSRTGTPGSLSDGGEEIASIAEGNKKSGTDSDKKRFDYPPDLHDYSRSGYHDYYSYYGYEQNGHRWDPNISEWVATTTNVEPQRQTPEKFMIPHMRACFGPNGQLVKILPNRPADGQPATVEIHDVHEMLEETEEATELNDFPGPLVRGDTHKNDVLLFCQKKAKSCTENMNMEDRESAEIIWKFLELLIKQNGTIVGTDLADLILQGHEPTTVEFRRSGLKIAASSDNLDDGDSEDGQKLSRGSTPIDRSFVNKTKSTEEVTDRFRHLLMYGRKKDALDWAMKNNLWGHALFLASKMDSRAHANVMARFANVAMRMNDPLQTLYQLMSGRQPAAVTCVAEERWGDWRPHLAMILSNSSQKADLDRKSITTLGDTLASKGFLHASHFCYLMSQTSFGSYNKKSSKIVLIGSSHGLPLEYFANNDAIQCTEIYEYALALGNVAVSLINFQTYKFLYATRLADYGYAQEALQYCEVISKSINLNPACYQHTLVKLVYDLSSQLKYSHPQDNDNDDNVDPDWLRALHTTLVQFEEGAIQPMSGSVTPAYFGGRTTASSDSGEVGMYMQGTDNGNMYNQDSLYVPQSTNGMYSIHENSQFAQHENTQYSQHENTQFSQQSMVMDNSNLQYQQQQSQYVQGYDGSQLDQYNTQQVQADGTVQTGQAVPGADNQYTQQQQQQQYEQNGSMYQSQTQAAGEGEAQWPEQPAIDSAYQQQEGFESTNQNQAYTANQQTDLNQQHTAGQYNPNNFGNHEVPNHWSRQKQPSLPQNVNLGDSQSSALSGGQRSSLASTSEEGVLDEGEDRVDSGGFEPAPSIFDIQSNPGKIIAPKLRKRTISETSNGSTSERHPSGNKSHNQQESKKSDNLSLSKQKQGASGGGIWGKIGGLFRGKNEMKLPDDKEPSIVWDADKNKWVDKNADETDDTPPAPPPKDNELSAPPVPSRKSSMPEPGQLGMSSSTNDMPPPSGGNKFSMKKGPKYVDVMNPKKASTTQVPSSLFHTLPNSHSAPAIFNPMGGSADVQPSEPTQASIPEEKSNPGADNSNTTQAGQLQLPPSSGESNLSRNSSGSSLSREVQRIMSKAAPGQTSALPTMFNPAQFQGNTSFKQPAVPGPGHRLSNRRVYPK